MPKWAGGSNLHSSHITSKEHNVVNIAYLEKSSLVQLSLCLGHVEVLNSRPWLLNLNSTICLQLQSRPVINGGFPLVLRLNDNTLNSPSRLPHSTNAGTRDPNLEHSGRVQATDLGVVFGIKDEHETRKREGRERS